MDLTRIILGPILTEKSERLKGQHTYTFKVNAHATKVDVKNALKRFYDIDAQTVRTMRVVPKARRLQGGRVMQKRHPYKKVMVTLGSKSKGLDLAAFQS